MPRCKNCFVIGNRKDSEMKNTINFMLIFILSILLVSKAYSCERMFNVNDGLEKSDLVYAGTIKSNVCDNNITKIIFPINDLERR